MTVCEWLEQVKKLDELINAKLAERTQVLAMATKMGADMDGMPHAKGNVSDPVGSGAVKLAHIAVEIDRATDQYVDLKQEIIAALEQLPEREYGVLHRHYIRYMTWEKVAEDMGYSTTQVWRIKNHGLALLWGMGYPNKRDRL